MTRLQLIDVLKKNNVDAKTIDYILSKNIKRLLGRNLEEIEKIIKLLKNENIEVSTCLSVLAHGKAEEIEKILKILRKENLEVSNCPTVLAHGKTKILSNKN